MPTVAPGNHPLRAHPHDKDQVLAGLLAHRINMNEERPWSIMERLNVRPLGCEKPRMTVKLEEAIGATC